MSDDSDYSGSENTVYDVERILAQREFDGEMLYLVKWQGYGEEQCTWEPPENFSDPQTLREWGKRLEIGDTLDNDTLEILNQRMTAYQDAQAAEAAQEEERRLRASKRHRLVEGPKPREFSSSESDTPMISKRSKVTDKSTSKPSLAHPVNPEAALKAPTNPIRAPNVVKDTKASPNSVKSATVSNIPQPKISAPGEKDKATATSSDTREYSTVAATQGGKLETIEHEHADRRLSGGRAGKRFNNLRHRNNYAKAAGREGIPDISRMELKSPDDWTHKRAVAAPLSPLAQGIRDSWLFVPEDEQSQVASPIQTVESSLEALVRPEIETSASTQGNQEANPRANLRQPPTQTQGIRSRRPSQSDKSGYQIDPHPSTWTSGLHDQGSRPGQVDQVRAQPHPTKSLQESHAATQVVRKDSMLPHPHTVYPLSRRQSESSVSANAELKPEKSVITTRSGRLFDKTAELLVFLSLGGHSVGDVKFLHLPPWLRTKFKRIKPPGETLLRIDFQQHGVKNWAEYDMLAKEFSGPPIMFGEIEAYEDTQKSADALAEYLERERVCAIWVYPSPSETVLMVLYSQGSPEWSHLKDKLTKPLCTQRLRLLFGNTRKPLYNTTTQLGQAMLRQNSGIAAYTGPQGITGLGEGLSEVEFTSSRNQLLRDTNTLLDQDPGPNRDHICGDTSEYGLTAKAGTDEMMHGRHTLSAKDFQYLTTVSSRIKVNPSNARIFIAFASVFPYVAQILREWLGGLVKARNIFSDTENDGWEEFLESSDRKVGVVLFHQKLPNFISLKHLSVRLQGDMLVCFNVSSENQTGRFSFERIFPRGSAICITESCMTGFLEPTLEILRWFEFTSKQKKSNWKLVLFPGVEDKCLQRLNTLSEGPQKTVAEIIGILLRLAKPKVCSPMDPDLYICGEKLGGNGMNDSLVLSPPPQLLHPSIDTESWLTWTDDEGELKARDRKFLEYIRAWTVLNCMNYRRFFVVDECVKGETEPLSCHIQFRHPEKFMRDYRIKAPSPQEN